MSDSVLGHRHKATGKVVFAPDEQGAFDGIGTTLTKTIATIPANVMELVLALAGETEPVRITFAVESVGAPDPVPPVKLCNHPRQLWSTSIRGLTFTMDEVLPCADPTCSAGIPTDRLAWPVRTGVDAVKNIEWKRQASPEAMKWLWVWA